MLGLVTAGLLACGGSEDCSHPPSQGLSEPCCLDLGVDACGANLFCATFDGRTVPTCFANHSRQDGLACAEDDHCASGSCNEEHGLCRSAPGTECTFPVGCAPAPTGARYGCVDGRCSRVGDGDLGSTCGENDDCLSLICENGRCF